jgi:hypothetical protein
VSFVLGNTAGSAVLGVLLSSLTIGHTSLPSVAAYHWSFTLSGLAGVAALGLCVRLARTARASLSATGAARRRR